MARPRLPAQLKLGPFTVDEARAAGLTASSLRGKSWRRLGRALYCWQEIAVDPWKHLWALQHLLRVAIFAGRTAAWMHGVQHIDPFDPIEVIVPPNSGLRTRRGLHVRRIKLGLTDVVEVRHIRATKLDRTLADLCPRLSGAEALALLDSVLQLKLIDVSTLARSRSADVRMLAPLAEPAESPMETRLRWLLLQAGLPRPQVQAPIPEARARADLYYPQARLVIEFDGGNHRDRMVEDNRRQNLLTNAGYKVLRFTASDIYNRPDTIVRQVSAAAAVCATRPAAAPR
jgi:very-short-patch-repair endonuclease